MILCFRWRTVRTTPQLGTLKQYFGILNMIYKRDTGAMLDVEVVCDMNAVSTGQDLHVPRLLGTGSLSDTMRRQEGDFAPSEACTVR